MNKNNVRTLNFALLVAEKTVQLHEKGLNLEKIKQEITKFVSPSEER